MHGRVYPVTQWACASFHSGPRCDRQPRLKVHSRKRCSEIAFPSTNHRKIAWVSNAIRGNAIPCTDMCFFETRQEERREPSPSNFLSHADSRCQTRLTAPFCACPTHCTARPPRSHVCSYLVAAYLNSDPALSLSLSLFLSVQGDQVILLAGF